MKPKMTRSEAGRKGGLARAKQFTSKSQRAARKKASSEVCARNGAKGAAATIAKHGYETLFLRSRKYRLNNPSKPELLMIGILNTLEIQNEREWRIGATLFTVDFFLTGYRKCIEVHGRVHNIFEPELRAQREAKKIALLAEEGIEVLVIGYKELADVPTVIERIKQFVGGVDRQSAPAQTGNG